MANKKSRYDSAPVKVINSGYYKGIKKRNTKFYKNIPKHPDDIYVLTQVGDRFDLLAEQFYGDSQLWWYIAKANNLKFNNIEVGTTIRIPSTTAFSSPG